MIWWLIVTVLQSYGVQFQFLNSSLSRRAITHLDKELFKN